MTVTASILQATGNNEQTYYQSLPREYYVSPEIFEKEYDKIFARQWILVGHESQIPARGDYFTIEIAGENIIITRTDETCSSSGKLKHHDGEPEHSSASLSGLDVRVRNEPEGVAA